MAVGISEISSGIINVKLRSALKPFRIDFIRKHGKEPAVSPNQSIDLLSDYQFLKESRAP
jgi:hypothetical protein